MPAPLSVGVEHLAMVATDTAGNAATVTWKVTYNQPATISTQPAPVSVTPGSGATLSVATSSTRHVQRHPELSVVSGRFRRYQQPAGRANFRDPGHPFPEQDHLLLGGDHELE